MSHYRKRPPILLPLLILPLSLWAAAGWLARDLRPEATRLAEITFGVALPLSYLCLWGVAIRLSRAPRVMLLRALFTTLVLTVLLAIVEIPAALGWIDYSYALARLSGEWTGPETIFVTDLNLGYTRPPNVHWEGQPRSNMAREWNLPIRAPRPQTFTTDSNGFRNTRNITKAEVVIIGDSYVEGSYVSDEETVASVLESHTGLSVANLGRAGYGTLQEMEVLRRYALPLRPDLVAWFFFEGNDLYNDEEFEGIRTYLNEHSGYDEWAEEPKRLPFRKTSFSVYSFRFLRRLFHPLVPNPVPTFGWFEDNQGRRHSMYYYDYAHKLAFREYEQERFAVARATVVEADRACRENGCRLVVFFIPMKFRVYGDFCTYPPGSPCREWKPWDLAGYFTDFCEESGIDCVDLTPRMRQAASSGLVLYAPEDSHWNAAGHRFVAELVREAWQAGGQEAR